MTQSCETGNIEPDTVDLIVRGGTVITMDANRIIYNDGGVAISGDRIVAVGKSPHIEARFQAETLIDATNCLILPGLIDAHNHPGQYLSKGIGDDVGILQWLYERVYPYEAHCTEDDVYIGALANFAEMILNGSTCFCDPGGYHEQAVARAADDIGIRGIISRSTRDLHNSDYPLPEQLRETTAEAIEKGARLVERYMDGGRLRAWFSLRVPYNVSDDLCRGIRDLAQRYNVGIHSHVCAQDGENEMSIARWGVRVLERLRRLDMLRSNLYLVHMGWVTDDEIALLAEHDVKVAHCPSASMHGAYGNISRGTFPKMHAAGVNISLGTDSVTAGRTLDMFRVMYLAACAHKDATLDPHAFGAHAALEMATARGARALLWDSEIGSLELGKKADLIVVDTRAPCWHPLGDAVRTLVYSGSGDSVRTVVVDGHVIMRDRGFPGIDFASLMSEVERRSQAILDRAGIRIPSPWPHA
jgi:cytosine/adenosine deaminase-related metal-dependent hydrolase